MSKSSALSMSVLFIFERQEIDGVLFLKAIVALFESVTVIVPFTTIYALE